VKLLLFHTSTILICLTCFNLNLNAQKLTVDNSDFFYQISPIYDFKSSIVSLTFDDASINQFVVALPMLVEKGIPATFYVITDEVDSLIKAILLQNKSNDYEIGSHTVNHHDLVQIDIDEAKAELLDSRTFLQDNFGINAGLTMSYPWGLYNNNILSLTKDIYLAARTTDPGYNSLINLNRYTIKVKSFDKQTGSYQANSWVDYAIQKDLWLVEMIHGIDGIGFSPISSEELSEHLDSIIKSEDKIWCSTVSNVIKYIDEAKNAKITCYSCDDTVYNIRIEDFLNDSIYNQALSVRVKVPSNWDNISITNVTKYKIEYKNESKFVLFNELPNNQLITIRPGSISAPKEESGIRLVYLSENPFFDHIKLSLEVLDTRDIEVLLCDMSGRILAEQKEKAANGVVNLYFETNEIKSGLYLIRIHSDSKDILIKKITSGY